MRRVPFTHAAVLSLASAGLLLLAACGSGPTAPGVGRSAPPPTQATATATAPATGSATESATSLPLGDGHVATSPRVGYVDSCQTNFNPRGGAFREGPWIHGDTWDPAEKLTVQGAVKWSQATYSAEVEGDQRIITTRDVPVGFPTGIFPISPSDPAYAYDRNPNTIGVKSIRYALPAHPTVAASPACVNMGAIGVLTDGVVLFNALDAEGHDAAAHEVLDTCGGHPQMDGEYHHHDIPPCLLKTTSGASTLVGYALDGFGIYVERDAQGNLPTNADLDACHGHTSPVTWDGQRVSLYHYVATAEYPYTIGCYMGTPVAR
jgi:hypothetical protein